ncbi:hypothetical protein [Reyranella sp.]|uniref:hypothetical protein n=1 Tax=Reyranella sp. TaxID=1929291 RepID=UPI003D0D354B
MALKLLAVDPVGGGGARPAASRVPIADGGGSDALLYFTAKLNDTLEREAAISRVSALADATSGLQNALDQKRIELSTDPDIAGREAKFRQFAQAQYAQASGGMDRETAALFKRTANPMADAMSSSVRHGAQKDTLDKALGALNDSTDKLVTASGDARNANERAALLDQADTLLKQARDGQILSEAQYQAARKATLGKADQAFALKLIRDNPGGTAAALGKAEFLPNLDPVTRQNLVDRAGAEVLRRTNLAYTQEARREVAERRATALNSNTIMKEVVDAAATPDGISDDLLARAKAVVPWHDYQAAKKLKVGGGDVDSKAALATIVPDIDTRDVSKDLSDALLKNEITGPTYKSLLERNRAALKDDQPQSPYRQGRDYIKTVLDPAAAGFGGGGALGGITAGLRADALMEYDTWADANRDKIKADPRLASDYALEVGRRYKLAEFAGTTQTLGLPRFTEVPKAQFDEPALDAATAETKRRFEAGEITPAEAIVQARLLQQWKAALQSRKAVPGEPAKPGGAK